MFAAPVSEIASPTLMSAFGVADAEAMTGGRKVGPAPPLAGGRIEHVDVFERPKRLLSAEHKDPVADDRGPDPAARGRDVGHRLPRVAPRVVALERCEVLQQRQLAA